MPNTLMFIAGISKIQTMADKSIQIRLETQELPKDQMVAIFSLKDDINMVSIAPIGTEVEPFDPSVIDLPEGKSPGQRLRNIIYILWTKDKQGYDDFDSYYPIYMNKLINIIKDKISQYD